MREQTEAPPPSPGLKLLTMQPSVVVVVTVDAESNVDQYIRNRLPSLVLSLSLSLSLPLSICHSSKILPWSQEFTPRHDTEHSPLSSGPTTQEVHTTFLVFIWFYLKYFLIAILYYIRWNIALRLGRINCRKLYPIIRCKWNWEFAVVGNPGIFSSWQS